jgi:hypothetical protein
VLRQRTVERWGSWQVVALILAAVVVILQCDLSQRWTVESPLDRWWSLTLLVGTFVSPAVKFLVTIATLGIVAGWAFLRLRPSAAVADRGARLNAG